jgi:hypothetical protein
VERIFNKEEVRMKNAEVKTSLGDFFTPAFGIQPSAF